MHDRTKHVLISILCGALLLCVSASGLGKIFWSRHASMATAIAGLSRDWNRVFQTAVRINRSHGNLEILCCDSDLESVMRQLRRTCASYDKLMEFEHGESMGRAIVRGDTGISRIIALGIEPQGRSVVFVLTQSPDDYEESLAPPSGHALDEIPVYPGSIARSFIQVEETHAQLEISAASANPEAIQAFFQSALALKGWKRMMPPANSDAGYSGIALFQKGFEFCCVLTQSSRHSSESIITVLHKRLNVK